MGVPLKEIKSYLDERTPEWLINLSRQKIAAIDNEIEKLNQIKHLLKETIIFTNNGVNADCDKIILEEQEEEYLIRSALLRDENSRDHIEWMIEYTKFMNSTQSNDTSFVGTMISRENIFNSNYNNYSYLFAKTSKKQITPLITIKPKGLYAVAYHHGSYETTYKTYERLLTFLEKKRLTIGEFAYEEYLLDEVAVKNNNDYITQITVEIKQLLKIIVLHLNK